MNMADLGRKWSCSECGSKFYDLGQAEATCPKCGTVQEPADDKSMLKRSARRAAKVSRAKDEEPDILEALDEEVEDEVVAEEDDDESE